MMFVNYDTIARDYAESRQMLPETLAQWLALIVREGCVRTASLVLDVGCGVARFTAPLAEATGAMVVGVDISLEMLKQAPSQRRGVRAPLLQAGACALPFAEASFDCVFMSHLLHHVADRRRCNAEAARCLKPGGRLLNRTGRTSLEQPCLEYRFFPEAREVDAQRMPTDAELDALLRSVGLSPLHWIDVRQKWVNSAETRLAQIRQRYISSLHLIAEEHFRVGLKRAERHALEHPDDPAWQYETVSMLVAEKPAWGLGGD